MLKVVTWVVTTATLWLQVQEGMVQVPAGKYKPLYGGDTVKQVAVDAFLMDAYLVTNADYMAFVKKYPEWRRSNVKPVFADAAYLKQWTGDTTVNATMSEAPVTNVSWFAARKYCACQGKRLAATDEWEYAGNASEKKPNGTDDAAFNERLLSWYGKPNPKVLGKVGSVFRNYHGIWDMHGLVWEWVEDFNSALITGDSRADTEASSNFFCGSAALGANDFKDYAAFLRYGFRGSLKANYCINNLGFRCAGDIQP